LSDQEPRGAEGWTKKSKGRMWLWGLLWQPGRATLVHAVHGPGGRSISARPAVKPFAQARCGAAADAGRAGRRLVPAARPAGL
jgi:hypothetical protein